jgi:hypothetical protein
MEPASGRIFTLRLPDTGVGFVDSLKQPPRMPDTRLRYVRWYPSIHEYPPWAGPRPGLGRPWSSYATSVWESPVPYERDNDTIPSRRDSVSHAHLVRFSDCSDACFTVGREWKIGRNGRSRSS